MLFVKKQEITLPRHISFLGCLVKCVKIKDDMYGYILDKTTKGNRRQIVCEISVEWNSEKRAEIVGKYDIGSNRAEVFHTENSIDNMEGSLISINNKLTEHHIAVLKREIEEHCKNWTFKLLFYNTYESLLDNYIYSVVDINDLPTEEEAKQLDLDARDFYDSD